MSIRRKIESGFCSLLRAVLVLLCAAGPAAAPALATELFYKNPVHPNTSGMGDPYVFRASDGRYYLYTTSGFEAWSSDDLVNWRAEGKVKTEHRWGVSHFWAPEVVEHNGKFYMYYSARGPLPDGELGGRIVVAVSDSPTGPFRDVFDGPMFDFGYVAIDPHVFIDDDGRIYLFYAKDGSTNIVAGRRESHIYGVELNDDMVTLKGEPVLLTRPDQAWELLSGGFLWNEGPFVLKHDGLYYLMYSANCYCHRHYAVGYAVASHPLGPYTKYDGNPVLSERIPSSLGFSYLVSGTGHHSVTRSPDGKEWIIVYHSHADPVAGSGGRQLNIDRLGFRPDGSLYVNGPTVTWQPAPSGATRVYNIAPEAKVTVSSTREGADAAALVDGEVVLDVRKSHYDWVSSGEGAGAWVELAWDVPRRLEFVLVYPSAPLHRRLDGGRVIFSDGTELDVTFPEEPGAAAIVPAPSGDIEWLRFVAGEPLAASGEAGLSEIMVLGYPLETAWIAVPRPFGQMEADDAIRLAASSLDPVHVVFTVDGKVVYEGATLPDGPVLRVADLGEGVHRLRLQLTDSAGRVHLDELDYGVSYARWLAPAEGAWLKGTATIRAELLIGEDGLSRVVVALAPVAGGERIGWHELFAGTKLPAEIVLDTAQYADGAYDLVVQVETAGGHRGEQSRRVVFENWTELVEPFLPPLDAGWFGVQSRLLAVEKSAGWEHFTDEPDLFWGDGSRLGREGEAAAWLVWHHPNVYDFRFTVFSTALDLEGKVQVAVSADGTEWTPVPFQTIVVDENPTGWYKLELAGDVVTGGPVHYVRFRLEEGPALQAGTFQLGEGLIRTKN